MAQDEDKTTLPDLPSFGRRRGRKLRQHQAELLEQFLATPLFDLDNTPPISVAELFEAPVRAVWLEIGFGGGEHLLWQARQNPDIGFIAAEPFLDGVVKVLTQIEADNIRNILIYPNDVRPLLRWLPAGSISEAFILFPDPWPKRKHLKRRLVAPALLGLLARLMPRGHDLHISTDIGDYARTILLAFQQDKHFAWQASCPRDWRERSGGRPATRYEAKALAAGRCAYHFRFRRN